MAFTQVIRSSLAASPASRQQFEIRCTGGPVIFLGILALTGWALDIPGLTRMLPGQATVKPNTAVALVMAGVGLLCLSRVAPRRWEVGAAAAVVLAIAAATLAEYGSGADLGIDEWLFRDPATVRQLHPGRMAVATALALLFTGMAMVLVALAVRNRVARAAWRVCIAAILTIGGLSVLGYLLDVVVLHTWSPFESVALPTAVAIVLLGWGLRVAGRRVWPPQPLDEDERITQAAAFALALAAGVTAIVGMAALEWQTRRSTEGELRNLLHIHVAEITSNLELRTSRAAIVTTRPNLQRHWRRLLLNPADVEARAVAADVLASFLSHDFSHLSITLPTGEEVARAGEDVSVAGLVAASEEMRGATLVTVPLDRFGKARLVWRDGGWRSATNCPSPMLKARWGR